MKKLNQNNAIATTAMLTKTNTMKNKMNFFAKVVILLVMMMMVPNTAWGQGWTQGGDGTWYILYQDWVDLGKYDEGTKSPTIYMPVSCDAHFYFYMDDHATNWPTLTFVDNTNNKIYTLNHEGKTCRSGLSDAYCAKDKNNPYELTISNLPLNCQKVTFGCTDRKGNTKKKHYKATIPLPNHINSSTSTLDFGTIPVNSTTDTMNISLVSFKTQGNLMVKLTSCTIGGIDVLPASYDAVYSEAGSLKNGIQIAGSNQVLSPYNPYVAASSNDALKIRLNPQRVGQLEATIEIYDTHDASTKKTITVSANVEQLTPELVLKTTEPILFEPGEERNIADIVEIKNNSIVQGTLVLSEEDNNLLTINNTNGTITANATGNTQIKAEITSCGNTNYESGISQTYNVEVSTRQSQTITWIQDFTALRTGNGPISLSASTSSGLPISRYRSDDTNIVDVVNGQLVINGVGQTYIHAEQDGDATYAPVQEAKYVWVRPAGSTGCEGTVMINQDYNNSSINLPTRGATISWNMTVDYNFTTDKEYYITDNWGNKYVEGITEKRRSYSITGSAALDSRATTITASGKGNIITKINIQVTYAPFLEQPSGLNTIDLGKKAVGTPVNSTYTVANYSNLNGQITAKIIEDPAHPGQSSDFAFNSDFTSQLTYIGEVDAAGSGCGKYGSASVQVHFKPSASGKRYAKLQISGEIGTNTVPSYEIQLEGEGEKNDQVITWNIGTSLDDLNANSTRSDKINQDANGLTINATTTSSQPLLFGTSNPDVAYVQNGELFINKSGDFSLYAYEPNGDASFNPIPLADKKWFTDNSGNPIVFHVSLDKPTLTFSASSTSIPVFSTTTLTASSYAGAKIKMTVTSKKDGTNPNATLSKSTNIASGENVTLTAATRASDAGEGNITVVASIDATDIYEAINESITVNATKVTPVISSFATLEKGYVGTLYDLSGNADWAEASGQPARSEWINGDGVSIIYTSSKHEIADDGVTFTPKKAGVTTISASIEAANNHTASSPSGNDQQPLQIDFNQGGPLYTFSQNTEVGKSTTEEISLANYFVPSGTYTVSVSGTGFQIEGNTSVDKSTNKFSVKFTAQTFDANLTNKDYTATITITDADSRVYSFTIKATAVKRDAGLTISYTGETFAFSRITFSNTKATTADVTYMVNGVTITGTTYKIPSVAPITISATTPATDTYKAGNAVLEPFTPTPVTPVLSWNQSDFGDKKVGDTDFGFTSATWTNTQGEPNANEWADDEVTIKYTASNDAITVNNGNIIHINKAGVATLTASIETEKNHNASNTISKTINIAFADGKTITLDGSDGTGTFVGESSQSSVDLSTEMVKAGDLEPTSTNQYFSVTFNGYAMDITFSPTIYNNGNITETFTFRDNGTGKEYTLLLSGKTKKHTPVIEWKDDKTLILSNNLEMKSLDELLKSCSYCDGATIKSSDADVVMVFKLDGTPAGEGEAGAQFWAHGNGQATITLEIPETDSHTASSSQATFTVSGIEDTRVSWNQSLVFEYNGTPGQQESLTAKVYRITSNEETGQSITYEIVSQNPSGIVSLTQDANGNRVLSPLIINGTGTATIKAIATATANYASSESSVRTITINEPASTSECSFLIGTIQKGTGEYNFNFKKEDHTDYYEVEEISYNYNVTGNNGTGYNYIIYDDRRDGDPKTIKCDVKNGNNIITTKEYTAAGGKGANGTPENKNGSESISIPEGQQVTSVTFTVPNGDKDIALTNVTIKPRKYLKNTSTTSHTFGSPTAIFVGQSETVQLTIAEYAFLNGNQVDMKLVNLNDDGDYAGGEFSILDKSGGDDWGKPCDYGKIKVHVQFAPLSGRDDAVHKCRIMVKGTIGNNQTSAVYFTLEGKAQRNPQEVIWTQDLSNWNSQTGEVFLGASSNQSDAQGSIEYEIVSQTAATSGKNTGVVTINGNKMTILKAGTVTIKAKHPGDDKYLPAEWDRPFTISRVNPDINLSHNSTDIVESSQIDVTLGEAPYTISGSAKYGDKVIPGYATGTGEKITFSSSETDVVSIVDDNKLKFNSTGTATITASIATDDIVNAASFTFTVNVGPSNQVVTITNDLTRKLVTTDTENGITLTATAVNELDATMISDGTITYEITDGTEYAEIKDGNKLVSKKNGVGNITVVAHSSQTSNYNAGTSVSVTFSMEKATPTISWTTAPGETMTFTDRMPIEATTDNDDEGAKILYVINSISGSATTSTIEGVTVIVPSQVGDIKVTPEIAGTKNYNALSAAIIAQYVTITNGLVTFTIADISMRYGDPTFTITPVDGGLKGYDAIYTIESSDYQYIANTSGEIVDGKINVLKANPGQPITVTPSFTLANYTISCLPFTVTIDKAVQSLTWDPTERGIAATYIGSYQMIDAPVIRFPYDGIENEITYTCSDNQYLTVAVIPGNRGKINVSLLQYSSTPVTITATYAGNGNVEAASTTTPLSITMELQPQKVEWDGVAPTISNIYTTNSTTDILATLKATAFASAFVHETGNIVQFKAETSGKCPNTATLVSLIKNEDNSYSVKYTGDGSGHVKITAFAERGNGYERTSSENEKTIEFDILPAPATVAWSSNEFYDAHYGDIITMTPTITPDKGDKVFTYTFEDGKNLTCQENTLSVNDVATEGTTITAWNVADCFLAADGDGYARSGVVINKTAQEIVWNQANTTLDVIGSSDVQLTAYAIDSRHKVQATTCLTLTNSEYITAKTTGDDNVTPSEEDMKVTYIVEEQTEEAGFCKITGQTGAIVTVDENGLLHVTGIGVGRVKITPVVSEGAHYTSASGTPIYVTVQKATRTITWNNKGTSSLTSASADITLDAHTTYINESISADEEGTKTYSIGTGGEAYVEIVEGVLKIKDNISLPNEGVKITVNVSFANSCRYADVNDSWTFTLTKVDIQLQYVPTTDILTFDNLTSTTKDFDLKTVLITNYRMTTNYPAGKYSYSFTSLNTIIATIDEDGVLTAYNMTEDESPLEIVVKATESVTGTFDSETIKIVITRGTLIFNIAEESDDNKWTNSANWSRPDIVENSDACGKSDYHYQMANYNVVINSECYIGKDEVEHTKQEDFFNDQVKAECNNLTIDGTNAKLTLAENASLVVNGEFTNGDASKLLLKANYWGQATVVFASAPTGHPKATVEMYLLPGSGNSRLPLWQYRGIIVDEGTFAKGTGLWSCMSVYEWVETENGSTTDQGCWRNYQRGSDASFNLLPWKGYAFANLCTVGEAAEEQWLTYTGRLINASEHEFKHEFTLTKTETQRSDGSLFANCGINLMTNSFSAPMPINSIDFGENNRTVTFYNAGTYAQWKAHSGSTEDDKRGVAGQLSSCPQKTSGETQNITAIPSGQAFFVTAIKNEGKVTFNYTDIRSVVSPSGRMFERGRENEMYNILTINVARKDNRDRVILVECDSCTRQYDNGYDGLKMQGDDGLLQIYAYNKFGKTAVNADSSFNKQYIGFVASDDNDTYTMSFNTDRLYGYHALYLTDRMLNVTVDILAGETYSFKGYTVGEDMRFQINGITEEEWQNFDPIEDEEDKSECDLRIVGKVLYVEGFTTSHYTAEVVEAYDMMGHLVWSTPLTSERIYDLPELPQGIYTIRLGDCHVKYSSMR